MPIALLPPPPRALRTAAVAFAVLAVAAGCAARQRVHPRAAELVERGYRHLGAGDPERAEVAFTHALAFDPDFPEAENGLGVVARSRGALDEARRRFVRAARLRPGFAEARANLGETLLAQERPREAEAALRDALRIDPDLSDARQNLARALIRRGVADGADGALLGQARRELLHLLESAPERAAAHHDLAFLAYRSGRYAEAEAGYRRAAALAPTSHEAHHGRCISLVRLGRCEEAIRSCERCLDLAPGAGPCRTSLAGALACGG